MYVLLTMYRVEILKCQIVCIFMCNIEEWDASDGNSAITVAYGMA